MRYRSTAEEYPAELPTCKGAQTSGRILHCPYREHLALFPRLLQKTRAARKFIYLNPAAYKPSAALHLLPSSRSRTSNKNILHFWATGTSSSFSHSRRRPREERNYRNPALMQQHCSTAGWNTTQPWHGLALQGGTQTPKRQRIQEERQNNYEYMYGTERIQKLCGITSLK